MKFLLPLLLIVTTSWGSIPIFDNVFPQFTQEISNSYNLPHNGNYRLPNNVEPIEYHIKLKPIFETSKIETSFTFEGSSEITLNITSSTKSITFHAKELFIDEKKAVLSYTDTNKTKVIVEIEKFSNDTEKDFKILHLKEDLYIKTKSAKLFLQYTGKLNNELRGFYRSSYEKDGKKMWLATTHFEPVSARQAFPCWDEPHLKAFFNIIITVPGKDYNAISNMEGTTVDEGKTVWEFKKTPKMSTYLVAFVVSDFKALSNEAKNFSVWTKPTIKDEEKKFALDFGLKTLEELQLFTGIDYKDQGMTKMDQIAIPDFAAGAMENWGLVTYREPRLLYNVDKTTIKSKQDVATIIAHEFSHQWFGNLVTCEWWDYIWLNEGFATFFQYYISDKVISKLKSNESWRFMEQFVIKNVQEVSFVVDANDKIRALNPKNSVQTRTEIRSLFDDIAYKKGASILYMMYGFLTEKIFTDGLKKYLQDHKTSTVNSDKLFNSIEQSNDKIKDYLPKDVNLKTVMDNWVKNSGYPVITVSWNKKSGLVNITQERFFLTKPTKEDKTQWYIPINYVTEESPQEIKPKDKTTGWMIPKEFKTFENIPNNTKWILFNKNQTGYYRVNYNDEHWKTLATYLKSPDYKNITAVNRAQLIDDALNLARAGYLSYKIALQLTLYLTNEVDYIPWYTAARAFNYLDSTLLGTKSYSSYHKYVANKIKRFASEVNYVDTKNGTHIDKLAKVLALNTACKYGLEHCENYAAKTFKDWLKNKNITLVPDLKSGILCAGLRKVNESGIWNQTLERYKNTKDETEKNEILAALGCTSKEIAQKFLALSLEKDFVINIFDVMNSIYEGNTESFDILMNFIRTNIEKIQKDKKDNSSLIAFLNKLAKKVVTPNQYTELSLFIHEHLPENEKFKGFTVALDNLAWLRSYRDEIEKWIEENCDVCQKTDSASSIALTSFLLIISLLFTRFY